MMSNGMEVTKILRALLLLLTILKLNKSLVSAVFEGCDHDYMCESGSCISRLQLTQKSCRYRYTAPPNHDVHVTCSLQMSQDCSNDAFYVSTTGDLNLMGSERFCGSGQFSRSSLGQTLVLAYIANSPVSRFNCDVTIRHCECGWSITRHIANGVEATINEYPSMVALKANNVLFCSATIISGRFLLTAAHCALYYDDINIMKAWVGRHYIESNSDTAYTQAYSIKRRIIHPYYTQSPLNNDIALLETTRDIQFSRGVGPICLPPYSKWNDDFSWNEVDVIGWGFTNFAGPSSPTLQKITVMTTNQNTCQQIYNNAETIFPTQICTRDPKEHSKKDSCQYDSGGPVILRNNGRQYLIGVISYGKGCASTDNPTGVNTRITSYMPWILQNIGHPVCEIQMQN